MGTLLLDCSLRAALMAVGTAAALTALRIRGPAIRHIAWTAVLVVMLLLPAMTTWGPKLSTPALPIVPELLVPESPYPETVLPRPATRYVEDMRISGTPITVPAKQPRSVWDWWRLALAFYFMGFGVFFVRLTVGTIRARAIVRRATSLDGVLVSAQCAAPVTVGWLRPVVVLPEDWQGWPGAKLDAVLTHEREHVRRYDPFVRWLALLNRSIFWFHPLAWWLERKLSDLSEQACDAAVLRRGHTPADYSQYLIELARSVSEAGARVGVIGTAMSGGALPGRVRRILDARPPSPLSRARMATAAALCLSVLVVFAACKPERGLKLAAGQPSMNELMHRRAAEREAGEKRRQALLEEVQRLTPEQAQALETEVKMNPQDQEKVLKLVRYYQRKVDVQGLDALTLWYIENEPTVHWSWNIQPEWNRAGYEKGKKLWLAQLKKPGAIAAIYRNAAAFLEGGDKPLAEDVLLAGQKAYPNEDWAMQLGMHYAQALLGSVGPKAEFNVVRTLSMEEAHGPYAQSLRSKLAVCNDANVLRQTTQWLVAWCGHFLYGKENPLDFDVFALAESYNERALSLQPDNEALLSMRLRLHDMETSLRLRNAQLENLNQTDRLRLLRGQVQGAFGSTNMYEVELKAKELLTLAAQNVSDPEYGNAMFFANLALGDAALRRGEKRQAARHLLAAADAPPTDILRYWPIDMTLARQLVDWGERGAVAQFLDRCARFNRPGKDLAEWAAQLRQGINPDLTPYHT